MTTLAPGVAYHRADGRKEVKGALDAVWLDAFPLTEGKKYYRPAPGV